MSLGGLCMGLSTDTQHLFYSEAMVGKRIKNFKHKITVEKGRNSRLHIFHWNIDFDSSITSKRAYPNIGCFYFSSTVDQLQSQNGEC